MKSKMRLNYNTFDNFSFMLEDLANGVIGIEQIPKITRLEAYNREPHDLKNDQILILIKPIFRLLKKDPELFLRFFQLQPNLTKWFKQKYLFNRILGDLINEDKEVFSFNKKASILFQLGGRKILESSNISFNFSHGGGTFHTLYENLYEKAVSKNNKSAFEWLLKNKIEPFEYKVFEHILADWTDNLLLNKSYIEFLERNGGGAFINDTNINRVGSFWPLFNDGFNMDCNQKIKYIENKYKNKPNVNILQWKLNTLNKARSCNRKIYEKQSVKLNQFIIDFIENHPEKLNDRIPEEFNGMKLTLVRDLILDIEGIDKEKINTLINLKISLKPNIKVSNKSMRF